MTSILMMTLEVTWAGSHLATPLSFLHVMFKIQTGNQYKPLVMGWVTLGHTSSLRHRIPKWKLSDLIPGPFFFPEKEIGKSVLKPIKHRLAWYQDYFMFATLLGVVLIDDVDNRAYVPHDHTSSCDCVRPKFPQKNVTLDKPLNLEPKICIHTLRLQPHLFPWPCLVING